MVKEPYGKFSEPAPRAGWAAAVHMNLASIVLALGGSLEKLPRFYEQQARWAGGGRDDLR